MIHILLYQKLVYLRNTQKVWYWNSLPNVNYEIEVDINDMPFKQTKIGYLSRFMCNITLLQ